MSNGQRRQAQVIPPPDARFAARFWSKVSRSGDDSCWLWNASTNPAGYGRVGLPGRHGGAALAHRVVWIWHHGPVPAGLELDHLCGVRNCVNPRHLEPVTHAENMRRSKPAVSPLCKRGHRYAPNLTSQGCRYCPDCEAIRRERKRTKRMQYQQQAA